MSAGWNTLFTHRMLLYVCLRAPPSSVYLGSVPRKVEGFGPKGISFFSGGEQK